MSKIHQAMQRAEREGRVGSSFQTSKAPEISSHKLAGAFDLARPDAVSPDAIKNAGLVTAPSLAELTARKTTLDSRVIAANCDTYDALAERLRQIKMDAMAAGSEVTSILLTSAGIGEGKSLTAINQSIAIARMFDQRVLLVDGNFRHPSIHEFLGLSRYHGLAEFLQSSAAAEQAITKTDLPNLFVVTAGTATETPTQLLNTRRMGDFLALIRQQFDWVFLDAPALIPAPDAELLSSFVDGIVLITGKRTQPSTVMEAMRLLRGKRVLGIVQNAERSD